jgi:hypothetical protein
MAASPVVPPQIPNQFGARKQKDDSSNSDDNSVIENVLGVVGDIATAGLGLPFAAATAAASAVFKDPMGVISKIGKTNSPGLPIAVSAVSTASEDPTGAVNAVAGVAGAGAPAVVAAAVPTVATAVVESVISDPVESAVNATGLGIPATAVASVINDPVEAAASIAGVGVAPAAISAAVEDPVGAVNAVAGVAGAGAPAVVSAVFDSVFSDDSKPSSGDVHVSSIDSDGVIAAKKILDDVAAGMTTTASEKSPTGGYVTGPTVAANENIGGVATAGLDQSTQAMLRAGVAQNNLEEAAAYRAGERSTAPAPITLSDNEKNQVAQQLIDHPDWSIKRAQAQVTYDDKVAGGDQAGADAFINDALWGPNGMDNSGDSFAGSKGDTGFDESQKVALTDSRQSGKIAWKTDVLTSQGYSNVDNNGYAMGNNGAVTVDGGGSVVRLTESQIAKDAVDSAQASGGYTAQDTSYVGGALSAGASAMGGVGAGVGAAMPPQTTSYDDNASYNMGGGVRFK